ncbi:unnamed protein product [Bursaphelenchus xylophilus]|uniref:(pine wood nematode) hypothetical protein n=1 Tax=Bursaphelenchus xylophilus TaxID=6326 RepID=A0A1I7SRC2_BURXY|nr:unnamed protein product [Bursaphelenchus xylophilus]CAG9102627.1 unnamed protein product [Bursaphelenchus xylophilus]
MDASTTVAPGMDASTIIAAAEECEKEEKLSGIKFTVFILLLVYSGVVLIATIVYAVTFRHHFIWLCRKNKIEDMKKSEATMLSSMTTPSVSTSTMANSKSNAKTLKKDSSK